MDTDYKHTCKSYMQHSLYNSYTVTMQTFWGYI